MASQKGQRHTARQPVARTRGRETPSLRVSQPSQKRRQDSVQAAPFAKTARQGMKRIEQNTTQPQRGSATSQASLKRKRDIGNPRALPTPYAKRLAGEGEREGRTQVFASSNTEDRATQYATGKATRTGGRTSSRSYDFSSQTVERARKLVVRRPNQTVAERNLHLRKWRVDQERIAPARLQKILSRSGVGSRREMEEWIAAGWVMVNGKKATLGDRVVPSDRVTVKGNLVRLKWADRLPRIILYHKNEGEMVTRHDPQGRPTVFQRLPKMNTSSWVAVGRLDVNTSGLLILTTSGELANRLMHPSFSVEREYAVRVLGALSDEEKKQLCCEVMLEDGPAAFVRISDQGGEGANHWYRVVLKEGRNREVRRLFEHVNRKVSRLMRIRFGNIALPPRLKRGQFYELSEVEVAAVMKWTGLSQTGSLPKARGA